jgi:hypothetical protein
VVYVVYNIELFYEFLFGSIFGKRIVYEKISVWI